MNRTETFRYEALCQVCWKQFELPGKHSERVCPSCQRAKLLAEGDSKTTFPAPEINLSAGGLSSPGTSDHPAAPFHIPLARRCIPKTTGEHPGEWHEALVSRIDPRTKVVMVSLRHVPTGQGDDVPISDVVFGVDAEKWRAAKVGLQVQCAWCKQWRVDGLWSDLPMPGATGAVSHGICPPCAMKLKAEVAA